MLSSFQRRLLIPVAAVGAIATALADAAVAVAVARVRRPPLAARSRTSPA